MIRRRFIFAAISGLLAFLGCPWRLEADSEELRRIRALMDWMKKLDEGYSEGNRKLVGVYVNEDGEPVAEWVVKKSRFRSTLELPSPESWWVYYGGDSGDSLRRHNAKIHNVPYDLQAGLKTRELRQVHSLAHNGRTNAAVKALRAWKGLG